jgi:hypothetical protein
MHQIQTAGAVKCILPGALAKVRQRLVPARALRGARIRPTTPANRERLGLP